MLDWIGNYGGFAMFFGFLLLDWLRPARKFPAIKNWRFKGITFFAIYTVLAMYLPLAWDNWLGKYRLFDLTSLSMWSGALIAFLVLQFVIYWWHRALHASSILWRWFHQMHHSAERVDIYGAFYFHPLDMAGFTLMSSIALVLGVGVSAPAAIVAITAASFCSMFQHSNLKTPRWIGYIVQRPESHSVHHQRDIQAYNYGDIALFDMIFGTFRNPKEWNAEAGFYDGSSQRMWEMLIGQDVTQDVAQEQRETMARPAIAFSTMGRNNP